MGEHVDNRKHEPKRKQKRKFNEDGGDARFQRVTFKNYLRELEEELLEDDYSDDYNDDYK
jgi:hypothetical protein